MLVAVEGNEITEAAGVTELGILTMLTLGGTVTTWIELGTIVLGPIVMIFTEGGIYT
jgi:hypothetical protein